MITLDKPLTLSTTVTGIKIEVVSTDDRALTATVEGQLVTDTGDIVARRFGIIRNGQSDRFSVRLASDARSFEDALAVEPYAADTPTGYSDLLVTIGEAPAVKADRDVAVGIAIKGVGAVVETKADLEEAAVEIVSRRSLGR